MSQGDIVKYLERHGVSDTCEIVKGLALAYGTVCVNIKNLERHGDIICVKREKRGNFWVRTWRLKEDGEG